MNHVRRQICILLGVLVLTLPACKGDAATDSTAASSSGSTIPTYSVGGTITGLTGTVVLQNNAGDDLTLNANGNFTFTTAVSAFDVTIKTNPASQVCHINNGAGIASANVTNVAINCAADSTWVQDAYLKASNAEADDYLGQSVAISGSTLVVSAFYEDSNVTTITNTDGSASADNSASDSGAAYVFMREASGNWVQDAYLKPSNADSEDSFGVSVGISGSLVVVGAHSEDSNQTTITNTDGSASTNNSASSSGAVYVFKREANGNWVQDAYLKASNAGADDQFGWSVAISGSTVVVGAFYEDSNQTTITNTDGAASADNSAANAGAVYVFRREASGDWLQDAYLKASNAGADDEFGAAVAISGSTIVVGARNEDSNQTTISNGDGTASGDNSASNAGAVYVFKRETNGNWVQDAYLKPSNAGATDYFGWSVAISGSTIVVGAVGEASNQANITNTDSSASADNSMSRAGAVYIFKRETNGDWVQDAYLKASNAGLDDQFGYSVAISGSTVVVGSTDESSNQATITNTDGTAPTDNLANRAAAVYVFKREASGNWVQDAYLKASNTRASYYFGHSVAISGSTVAVGAYQEASDQVTITNTDGSASANNSKNGSGAAYVFKAH